MYGSRRFARRPIPVNPHTAEVVAKARLHQQARPGVERLASGPQDVVNNWRDGVGHGALGWFTLQASLVQLPPWHASLTPGELPPQAHLRCKSLEPAGCWPLGLAMSLRLCGCRTMHSMCLHASPSSLDRVSPPLFFTGCE